MTDRHPNAEIVQLQECFRCGDAIVESANKLIAHNRDPLATPMIGMTGQLGQVFSFSGRSGSVAETVTNLHRHAGFAWRDIAVMARSHRTLRRLADVFREKEIPYHRVGGGFDVCRTDDFKLMLSAMKLAINPRDNMAFRRLAPALGIEGANSAAVRLRAAEANIGFFEAAMHAFADSENAKWKTVSGLIAEEHAMAPSEPDETVIADCEMFIGLVAVALGWVPDHSDVVQFWKKYANDMTLEEALRWYGTRSDQEDLATNQNVVTLLTVHAAKGLEWPVCIIAGCNEGDFPSSQSKDEEAIAEERRIFYVSETRAKEAVWCHWRRAEDQAEGRKINPPSRFLAEARILGNGAPTKAERIAAPDLEPK
jgi:superfamily I DNA/RNA helicase